MRRLIIAVVLALLIGGAVAADSIRDPLALSMRQYGAILGMTMLGGLAGWYTKVSRGELSAASLFALIGEMTISALAGLGTFFVFDYAGVPIGVTAAAAGMAGYAGGRLIDLAEKLLQRQIVKRFGPSGPAPLDEK